jgi:hypothetical protein
MASFVITKQVVTPGGTITGSRTITAEQLIELEVALTSEQANKEITVGLVRANVQALVLHCDKAATVKINSSGNPASVTLLADVPQVLAAAGDEPAITTVFSADITSLFVTNGAAAAATFTLRALVDPTP